MQRFLITGASGFLGSLAVRKIMESDAYRRGEVQIYGTGRDRKVFQKRCQFQEDQHFCFIEADVCSISAIACQIPKPIDYIIHCAAPTASAYMIAKPVETVESIVLGMRATLELARRLQIKSMVFLSSMEVYGVVPDIGRPRSEEELGSLDLCLARNCYPIGKRMAEHYCCVYWKEYGVPVKIARLAQTFGQGVRLDDRRVFMQFARAAVEGRDIILKTKGESMGNYCASEDAAAAVFMLLEKGGNGETYNVVNEANTMRILDMAHLVAQQVAGGRIGVRSELESPSETGYAPDTGLRLSGAKLRKLGWQPTKGLAEMYWDVIRELQKAGRCPPESGSIYAELHTQQ